MYFAYRITLKPSIWVIYKISEDMSDDADVFRQVKCLYIRVNIISRKFANCRINVKLFVFKTCSCLYTSQLWGTCLSRTMNRLNEVAYNDSLRMVLGIPRYCSASDMFAYTNVPSCQCVIRLNIYTFMKRIQCMYCRFGGSGYFNNNNMCKLILCWPYNTE